MKTKAKKTVKKKPIHTGKELKKAIAKSGLPVTFVSENTFGCSRNFLYRIMKSNKFPDDKLKAAKLFIKQHS